MNQLRAPTGFMRERALNRWELTVSTGIEWEVAPSGERRRKRKRSIRQFHGTKREAKAALARFVTEVAEKGVARSKEPFGNYLDAWLEAVKPTLAQRTYKRYCADAERFLKATLGAVPLNELTKGHFLDARTKWIGKRDDGREGPRAAATVNAPLTIARICLNYAVDRGDLNVNPTTRLKKPRAISKRERPFLDEQQVANLLDTVTGTDVEAAIALGFGCGLRRSELLAVRWSDYSQDRAEINVVRAMESYDSDQHTATFKTTKSGKARVVAVPSFVVDALTRHFARQAESRNELRQNFNSNQTIVADRLGRPQNPLSFTAAFRRALKRAGLRDGGTHIMRHTYATLALQSGADVLTVSRALGHHDAGFTLREYGHILAGAQAKVAAGLDAAINRARVGAKQATKRLQAVPKFAVPAKVPAAAKQENGTEAQTLTA